MSASDTFSFHPIWSQFGAAIEMLENAIRECPEELWGEEITHTAFWYVAYHTLFYLDCYASESVPDFSPPPPFTLDELDERGLLPERVYTKHELLAYLAHGREKNRVLVLSMTAERARERCPVEWLDLTRLELVLYSLRHVQHHAAQLHWLIARTAGKAPRWVRSI